MQINKNILIIDTGVSETAWLDYFNELSNHNLNLYALATDQKTLAYFISKNWPNKNFHPIIEPNNSLVNVLIFFVLRPILFLFALKSLFFYKFSKKIDTIICFNNFEKLHFSRAARLLKIKTIWISNPGANLNISNLYLKSLASLSKKINTLCLDKKTEEILKSKKYNFKNVLAIKIGLKENQNSEQKNIFESLARTNSVNNKKFFNIGAIQELKGDIENIEKLLHATKKCLQVIPHLQLIIAGDGEEKKKISWMAQKMDISNLVWFVGGHKNPQKWISNFDLYIATSQSPKLGDLCNVLLASINAKSIIGSIDQGLEEFVVNNQTGLLVDICDSEKLAAAIIDLQQNHSKRLRFEQNGRKYVQENFQLANTINHLVDIIKQ